ncbi:hypothetical protein GCM10009664_55460 [Kitasatospora gansuensis]
MCGRKRPTARSFRRIPARYPHPWSLRPPVDRASAVSEVSHTRAQRQRCHVTAQHRPIYEGPTKHGGMSIAAPRAGRGQPVVPAARARGRAVLGVNPTAEGVS